jgi:hypothetical protein
VAPDLVLFFAAGRGCLAELGLVLFFAAGRVMSRFLDVMSSPSFTLSRNYIAVALAINTS